MECFTLKYIACKSPRKIELLKLTKEKPNNVTMVNCVPPRDPSVDGVDHSPRRRRRRRTLRRSAWPICDVCRCSAPPSCQCTSRCDATAMASERVATASPSPAAAPAMRRPRRPSKRGPRTQRSSSGDRSDRAALRPRTALATASRGPSGAPDDAVRCRHRRRRSRSSRRSLRRRGRRRSATPQSVGRCARWRR